VDSESRPAEDDGGTAEAALRAPGRTGRSLPARLAGSAVGVALFGAALWIVWSNREQFTEALEHTKHQPWVLVALVILLPAANWLLVALSFWVLMRRHGRLGAWEMCALIANAWLLNYLPLRPGMVSRLTWHKVVNGISVKHSAGAIAILAGTTGGCAALLLLIAVALGPRAHWALWTGALGLPLAIAGVSARLSGEGTLARAMGICFILRFADMLVWSVRYAVSFELVGTPVGLSGAIALGGVSQVAMMVPISGNGLGLREWLIGLTGSVLPAALVTAQLDETTGLAADLVNRAAELLIALPAGLLSGVWLAGEFRRWRHGREPRFRRRRRLRRLSARQKDGEN